MEFKLHTLKEEISTTDKIIYSVIQYFWMLFQATVLLIFTPIYLFTWFIALIYGFLFTWLEPKAIKLALTVY